MGLARWRAAQRAIVESGADLVLCGHDHQEAVGTLEGGVVISTASTLCTRTRGRRPTAFNLVTVGEQEIEVQYWCWEAREQAFRPKPPARFPRRSR
jgi:3',5'-cyclic AMP phosphodiesterase CpdA